MLLVVLLECDISFEDLAWIEHRKQLRTYFEKVAKTRPLPPPPFKFWFLFLSFTTEKI